MTVGLGVALVCLPLVLSAAVAFAIRETPVRSEESKYFEQTPTSVLAPVAVVLVAVALYLASPLGRVETFFIGLILFSMVGAAFVERKLLHTIAEVTQNYANPGAWIDAQGPPGPRWRYEMQARYITDPEWVDLIALDMISRCETYAEFVDAVSRDQFPDDYADVLGDKPWGAALGTTREIMKNVVIGDVLDNDGRFKPPRDERVPVRDGKSPEEVFGEFRQLFAGHDWRELDASARRRLMDRWQYYWTLRNLNLLDLVLARARGVGTVLGLVLLGTLGFLGSYLLVSGGPLTPELLLRAEAAGALLWLILICGGASILFIGIFRGTGAFSISRPTRGVEFDPLWTEVISVGILAFAVAFVVYGIGGPFLLNPGSLSEFVVDAEFLAYAAGSFLFCMFVFVVHTVGVHNLMVASRNNALDRASEDLREAASLDAATLDHFKDIRRMRVWPLRASTVFQLLGGILLPIAVQGFLIYAGLER